MQFAAALKRAKSQKPTAEMTKDEFLERYQLQRQYGTYRVEGNKLIRKAISAAVPTNEGRESTREFRVDGDMLIVTSQNAEGQKVENQGRLFAHATGQPRFRLWPESATNFYLRIVPAKVRFSADSTGAMTVTLDQGGGSSERRSRAGCGRSPRS